MGEPLRKAYRDFHNREAPIEMDNLLLSWKDIVHVENRFFI